MILKTIKLINIILLYYILIINCQHNITINDLKLIQSKFDNVTTSCHGAHSSTKNDLRRGRWREQLGDVLAIVYPFCLKTHELGNKLGNYFQELACAEVSGIHFIATHKEWDLTGSSTISNDSQKLKFLNGLPDIVLHDLPVDYNQAVANVEKFCSCTQYCWQDSKAPWLNTLPSIRKYIRQAIEAYHSTVNVNITVLSNATDLTNAKNLDELPLIPDVAIQYRCGDNIAFSYMYGILPFYAFPSRIPPNAKYIYVLSDHPTRSANSPYSVRCPLIMQGLFDYLVENFPNATIVIKRGGDLFLDYVRLAKANTTICSASTYCFWPALASYGTVYFPVSYLIAGADNLSLAPNLTSNFIWIGEPGIISSFKNIRPWTQVVDMLKGKIPFPS
mmetsp:Transcript_12461/g.11298  ORF Transcript_12461/g.11298 Transcript_12461/m.11298 type:complete len:390 (-) Transcript_12461:8-1177(-)